MTTTATAPTAEQQPEQPKQNAALEWLKGQYALFILIVLLIIAALSSPAFLTGTNITNLLLQMSIIGVVVMAELIIVLTGGIDISVGSALGLAAVLCAGLFGGFSFFGTMKHGKSDAESTGKASDYKPSSVSGYTH